MTAIQGRRSARLVLACALLAACCPASPSTGNPSIANPSIANLDPPLPDAGVLFREVEQHQKQLDLVRENYTFRAVQTTRELEKNGNVKKTESETHEIFFVHGHKIERLTQKNGIDLSPEQAAKEQARVEKEVRKYEQPGQQEHDSDDMSVARLLAIVAFSSPRRITLNGRSTIQYDFRGDPHAKTHGRGEEALKKVSGRVWIDEQDREVSRMEATLDDNFHLGFGLLASVAKGSNVVFAQGLIRNEAWLPTAIQLHLQARAVLVIGLRAEIDIRFDQYRKFTTDAVQQPGATVSTPQPQ